MNIVIDRIEDDIALLDVGGEIIDFPVEALPENAKEGDLLGFVILDNSELLAKASDRIERMKAMSNNGNDNTFDI